VVIIDFQGAVDDAKGAAKNSNSILREISFPGENNCILSRDEYAKSRVRYQAKYLLSALSFQLLRLLLTGYQHLIAHPGNPLCHIPGQLPGIEGADPDPVISVKGRFHGRYANMLKALP